MLQRVSIKTKVERRQSSTRFPTDALLLLLTKVLATIPISEVAFCLKKGFELTFVLCKTLKNSLVIFIKNLPKDKESLPFEMNLFYGRLLKEV